ncbi:hypothetical protein C8R43DRAFT_1008550 [Mycena crocata]|nr:hypothetical protein C8R43DRAFT_1008550 [Mycena crocata]
MSTLEFIWEGRGTYKLWSWTNGNVHYVAHFIRRLDGKNNICTVRIGERGSPTAPRSNRDENADLGVIKMAFTPDASDALDREAQFYAQMQNVQGSAVPRCLGHFHSKSGGSQMSCLILDYCRGVPGEQMQDPYRKIMSAAYAVHASGVMHGDLLDGRHFVKGGRRMMIVDFAAAVPHRCDHGRQVRGPDGHRQTLSCPELSALERIYGIHQGY